MKRTHDVRRGPRRPRRSARRPAGLGAPVRDHGGLIFSICATAPAWSRSWSTRHAPDAHALARSCRAEYVLEVEGRSASPAGHREPAHLPTGEIEVLADRVEVLNPCQPLPFRSPKKRRSTSGFGCSTATSTCAGRGWRATLCCATSVVKYIRDFLDDRGFLEIETPILIKSTPEGARDYLVPSRLHPGSSTRCRSARSSSSSC